MTDDEQPLEMVLWEIYHEHGLKVVPAPPNRDWMPETTGRSATACLPLSIASSSGWLLLNNTDVSMRWRGGSGPDEIDYHFHDAVVAAVVAEYTKTEGLPRAPAFPHSNFGGNIATWYIPYVFQLPPGWNLLARGPSNYPKDGAYAFEGIIEADWSPAPYTMNWMLTRPGHWVDFKKDEPICMIVPQRRHDLERFQPVIKPLESDQQRWDQWAQWSTRRGADINANVKREPGQRLQFDKNYMRGRFADGTKAPEHQTRVKLRDVKRVCVCDVTDAASLSCPMLATCTTSAH